MALGKSHWVDPCFQAEFFSWSCAGTLIYICVGGSASLSVCLSVCACATLCSSAAPCVDPVFLVSGGFYSTPLHMALRSHHMNVARELVESGAFLDTKDIYGKAPLDMAPPEERQRLQGFPVVCTVSLPLFGL